MKKAVLRTGGNKDSLGKETNRRRRYSISRICLALALIFMILLPLSSTDTAEAEGLSGGDYEDVAVDPTGKGEGYSAVLYDNTNGLVTSEANAIAETKEGFIWIGSYSGLIRYDGNTFERIDSTTGITSVVSLYVDSKNRLWIGTNDNGVAMMDKGEIKLYSDVEGLKSSSIRSFVEDSDGQIYVATTLGLGVINKDLELHTVDISQINTEYICELRKGPGGRIYGITMNGAVFTMEKGQLTGFYDGEKIGTGPIISVYPDPKKEGYVYLSTEGSEIIYCELSTKITNEKKIDVSPLTHVNSMEDFNDVLWVCADNGIGMVVDGKFIRIQNIPMNNSIDRILLDYEGNLWFTSIRQGVMKIVPNQFTNLYEWYGIPEEVVNATCRYDDKLFVATDTGLRIVGVNSEVKQYPIEGVERAPEDKADATDLIKLLHGCRIRSIVRDRENRLWFATYSGLGLVRFDGKKAVCYTFNEGLPSDRARTIYERSDGVIMVACSGGLALIDGDKVTEVYDDKAGLSNTEVLTIVEADNGDMILGSDGAGLYVISDKKVRNLGTSAGLSSGVIMRIKKSRSKDLYWLVTSNSISYMTPDYQITTVKKFPYSNNFDLYENSQGEMWVLSSNGIYVASVDQMIANEELSTVFYSRDNGLPSVTTANSYSELTEEGDLYIAGVLGVTKVNIEKPFENVANIKVSVPYVDADGVMIYPNEDGSFDVPSSTTRLTIYSYVYTYSLLNPQVTYHLDGFDSESVTVSRTHLEPVAYTNLSGGKYNFIIELKDAMGKGNKELSFQITKQKAVYEEVWFIVLMIFLGVVLLTLVTIFFVRRKTKALLKKQHETKLFIREMIEAFAKTIDMKDKYTNGHSTRVAEYTAMLTKELGYDEETVENYYNIALLHDIGKIAIPPEVLNKPGKLTDQEFKIIKSHSSQGYRVLKDISIMPELAVGAGAHHERPDGKGYPKGLKGDEIPRVAQIIAVADTFDAMYSDRPYRKRMNFEKAVSIIKEVSGTQLQGDVVDAFLRLVDKGEFRAPDDTGGGTTEDIDNIHKKQNEAAESKEAKESKDAKDSKEEKQGS